MSPKIKGILPIEERGPTREELETLGLVSKATQAATTEGRVLGSGYEERIAELEAERDEARHSRDCLRRETKRLRDARDELKAELATVRADYRALQTHVQLHPYGSCTCGGEGKCGWIIIP
jgi:uncharacterized coiled-coil DUF342 family protein